MKTSTITLTAAAALSAAVLGLAAPAAAAPSGTGDAHQTIAQLENQGNRVIVNRQSSAPLNDASIVGIRQGSPIQEYTWDLQRDDRILETVGHVLFVDVK